MPHQARIGHGIPIVGQRYGACPTHLPERRQGLAFLAHGHSPSGKHATQTNLLAAPRD
ncbi:MAG: hypothetical protein R3C68_03205 [Myxococcota bacterium]